MVDVPSRRGDVCLVGKMPICRDEVSDDESVVVVVVVVVVAMGSRVSIISQELEVELVMLYLTFDGVR